MTHRIILLIRLYNRAIVEESSTNKSVEDQYNNIVDYLKAKKEINIKLDTSLTLDKELLVALPDMLTLTELIFYIEEMNLKNLTPNSTCYIIYQCKEDNLNKANAYNNREFIEVRKKMNKLKKTKNNFLFLTNSKETNKVFNQIFYLFSSILKGWKQKDWPIVNAFLTHSDYKIVAKELQKDKSLMWRRKNSLKILEYAYLKNIILHLAKTNLSLID